MKIRPLAVTIGPPRLTAPGGMAPWTPPKVAIEPSGTCRDAVRGARRRDHGNGVCRRGRLARRVARRHGTLLDGEHWRAGLTMEHAEKAGLVALNHDRDLPSVPADRGQEPRRGGV